MHELVLKMFFNNTNVENQLRKKTIKKFNSYDVESRKKKLFIYISIKLVDDFF